MGYIIFFTQTWRGTGLHNDILRKKNKHLNNKKKQTKHKLSQLRFIHTATEPTSIMCNNNIQEKTYSMMAVTPGSDRIPKFYRTGVFLNVIHDYSNGNKTKHSLALFTPGCKMHLSLYGHKWTAVYTCVYHEYQWCPADHLRSDFVTAYVTFMSLSGTHQDASAFTLQMICNPSHPKPPQEDPVYTWN